MFGRRLSCLLALLPAIAPGLAQDAPAEPFISRTHVVAPHKVGDYVLEGSTYDARNRRAGVAVRYALADRPETRFDLFVYPAGRMPARTAIDKGMEAFRASFEAGATLGYYRDVRILEDAAFVIDPAAAAGGGSADPADRVDPADPLPADLQALLLDERIQGRRMKIAFIHQPSGLPMRSRGYLFYRHLNFFKGRISAAESRIDEDAFDALTDHAMRTLVPAISALNVGACATIEVFVAEDGEEGDASRETTQRSLVSGLAGARDGNCTGAPGDAALAAYGEDVEVVTIDYAPGDWNHR